MDPSNSVSSVSALRAMSVQPGNTNASWRAISACAASARLSTRASPSAAVALRTMFERTGARVEFDGDGLARRGLIVRHLVLPGEVENSLACLRFVAHKLSPDVWVSVMAQYTPTPAVARDATLGRRVTEAEYAAVLAEAERLGLERGWRQRLADAKGYSPDFDAADPFAPVAPEASCGEGASRG